MSEPAAETGGLRKAGAVAPTTPIWEATGRELFVRHARKDGRAVVSLRAVDHGDSCVVTAEMQDATAPASPGPYVFATPTEATAFVTEAVEALMYLGCEITA